MRDWLRWNWEPVAIIGGIVTLLVGLIWLVIWDGSRWDEYSAKHHCQRTGNIRRGYTYFTSTSCGNGCTSIIPVIVPDDYEYACDDNTRHWR